MSTHTATKSTALDAATVYVAHDRFVCLSCAGYTAATTGRTAGGAKLRKVDQQDVAEWASYDLGPLVCECGKVSA